MSPQTFARSEPHLPALSELGVGITYSSAVEPLLAQHPELFDVVEFEPQTTWIKARGGTEPYRAAGTVLENLARLPGRKLVHSIGAPVGGTVRPEPAQFELLAHAIARLGSPWFSEHLSFNATPEFKTGFFLPPRQTREGVEAAVRSIHDLQSALTVPVAIETGVSYLKPRPDEIPDGDFVGTVAERSDCGILLDLHNIFTNALNGRQPVEDFLSGLPLDRVWEMHIAGGFEMEGFWLDAHSGAIPDPLLDIARWVVPELPNLKAIIFEIYPSFVPVVGLDLIRAQIEKLHELWQRRNGAGQKRRILKRELGYDPDPKDGIAPAAWERALGALVVGRQSEDAVMRELAQDPGVGIVNRLVKEFRASMIVSVLRQSSRLLMLALGPDVFRAILEDFWSKLPPQMYASSEAEAFAEYLQAIDLRVPQLSKILEFEMAVMATLIDDQTRIIAFDFDPLPLMRALAEGHLPDVPGQSGPFEIEITPDGTLGVSDMYQGAIRQMSPFH